MPGPSGVNLMSNFPGVLGAMLTGTGCPLCLISTVSCPSPAFEQSAVSKTIAFRICLYLYGIIHSYFLFGCRDVAED